MTVLVIPGDSDYTVITSVGRVVPGNAPSSDFIFTLHEDLIAQEGDETLQIKLTPTNPDLFGEDDVICDTLNVTIVDNTGG